MERLSFVRVQYTSVELKRIRLMQSLYKAIVWGGVLAVSFFILALSVIEYVRAGNPVYFVSTIVFSVFITIVSILNCYKLMSIKLKDL